MTKRSNPTPGRSLNAVVCSWVRELQETLSASTIALEISSRNARVQALQRRWDYLRASLDLILNQRGADMADLPGGASGLLVRGCKGKETDRLVTRIGPGVGGRGTGQWKTRIEEPKVIDASPTAISLARICNPGKDRGDGAEGGWRCNWNWNWSRRPQHECR